MRKKPKKVVILIVGPTAAGKSELSLNLCRELPAEIVSADSRQIYKYMDIGTAKPSKEILTSIPHHFIDILEPDEYYSAGQFGLQAREVIDHIFARDKIPLVVGGSGLYIKALLEGFFIGDSIDLKIRESLRQRLIKEGSEALHGNLLKVDPQSASQIHPNDSQRILRALEVYLSTGKKLSDLHRAKVPLPDFIPLKFGIVKERSLLYRDIDQRVERMFQMGLLKEVATILQMGFDKTLNSLNTVGYKEVIQYLDGKIDYQTCMNLIKQNSRHYAKRQLTWFRADTEIRWHKIEITDDFKTITQKIIKKYQETLNR